MKTLHVECLNSALSWEYMWIKNISNIKMKNKISDFSVARHFSFHEWVEIRDRGFDALVVIVIVVMLSAQLIVTIERWLNEGSIKI